MLVEERAEGPRPRLVDYDTTFVPALSGKKSAEVGHRNYQHPDRTEDDFGLHLDHFPALVVHTALRALAHRPGLWSKYDTGENVLFRAADFYDPGASPLFEELDEIGEIERAVSALRSACHLAPEDVPLLSDVRSGAVQIDAPAARRAPRRRERAGRRTGMARWFAPALAMVLVCVVLPAALGQIIAALALFVAAGAAGAGLAARGYRRRPVVRRRRRLRQEAQRFTERIENLRREEETLRKQRAAVLDRREERRARRLGELREGALHDRLKHHFIGEVRALDGLSHKTVVRLKAAGIRTAYEAMPQALGRVTKLGDRSKARLRLWRAALVKRYADEQPDTLSPAQERRLERFTERRTEQIDAESARTRRKIEAQEAERADAEARAEALPALFFGLYVRYLLRLAASLPAPEEAPAPPPAAPPEREVLEPPPEVSVSSNREDAPWYGQHG